MKGDIPDIEDIFKSGIDQYKDMPPETVWNSLDAALDKSNAFHKKLKQIKKWSPLMFLLVAFIVFELCPADFGGIATRKKPKERTSLSKTNILKGGKIEQEKLSSISKTHKDKKERTLIEKEILGEYRASPLKDRDNSAKNKKEKERENQTISIPNAVVNKGTSASQKSYSLTEAIIENKGLRQRLPPFNNKKKIESNTTKANSEILNGINKTNNFFKNKSARPDAIEPTIADNQTKKPNAIRDTLPNHAFYNPNISVADVTGKVLTDTTTHVKLIAVTAKKPPGKAVAKQTYIQNKGGLSGNVFYSLNFNFSYLKTHKPEEKEEEKDKIKQKEQNSFSSTIGILGGYNISKKWRVQSGFAFSNTVIKIEPQTIYARKDRRPATTTGNADVKFRINSSAGFAYLPSKTTSLAAGDSIQTTKSTNTLQYASIPVIVNYHIQKGHAVLSPTIGLWMNFLTRQQFETTLEKGGVKENILVKKMDGVKSGYFSAMLGLGLEYNVNKTVSLYLTPATHFGLSSITKEGPVKSYYNSLSLMTGLQIKF